MNDFIKKILLDRNNPLNMMNNIKNGNIKFFKFGEYQGTEGFTQPAKPELDARKLKVCDGNCEDCW